MLGQREHRGEIDTLGIFLNARSQSLLQLCQTLNEAPAVQSQLALQRALNRPGSGARVLPIQRIKHVILSDGKRTTKLTLEKAAKMAARDLIGEYKDYDGDEEALAAAIQPLLESLVSPDTFEDSVAFVAKVRELLSSRTDASGEEDESESESEEDESESESKEKEVGSKSESKADKLTADKFRGDIKFTLGKNKDTGLVEFYVGQLQVVIDRLEAGSIGVRWLTLTPEQKMIVLSRLVQAMVALGNSQGNSLKDVAEFFNHHTVILHGSYLFGASRDVPGDIDLIISGGRMDKTIGIAGKLTRPPNRGDFSVGSKAGLLDYIVGIAFSEPGEQADLADDTAIELFDAASDDIGGYIGDAKKEKDPGKKWRKYANIAVAINYLLSRFDKKSELLAELIRQANAAMLGERQPNVVVLAPAVEAAFAELKRVAANARKAVRRAAAKE